MLKLILAEGDAVIDGILWNAAGTPDEEMIRGMIGSAIDVLGQAQVNDFRGKRSPQIILEDLWPAAEFLT